MSKEALGELQQLIMLALLRLGSDAYGARVRQELIEVAGRDVTISAIYVTLVRLEDDGLVRSFDGATPPTGGRPRRCFSVTHAGRERLRATRDMAARMAAGLTV